MGKLIIPNEIRIKGPWLLNEKALEELHETIIIIERKIDEACEIEVKELIEEKFLETKKWRQSVTREEVLKEVNDRLDRHNSRQFIFYSKDDKRIEDSSIENLLKDKNILDFKPIKLLIKIIKGTTEFEITISKTHIDELQTRLRTTNDNFADDINYELNKWIRKYQPNFALQKWNTWSPFFIFPLISLIFFSSLFFMKSKTELYQNELLNQCKEILIDGVSADEVNLTLEIIMKIETKYLPKDYKSVKTNNQLILKIWGIALICAILLMIKPITIFGVGKNKSKLVFYNAWIKLILVFIPLSIILPVILNKL